MRKSQTVYTCLAPRSMTQEEFRSPPPPHQEQRHPRETSGCVWPGVVLAGGEKGHPEGGHQSQHAVPRPPSSHCLPRPSPSPTSGLAHTPPTHTHPTNTHTHTHTHTPTPTHTHTLEPVEGLLVSRDWNSGVWEGGLLPLCSKMTFF